MTTPPPLQQTLTYRLHLLHKISDQESQKRYFDRVGLSLSEGRCLASIGTFAPLSVNDLAKAANLNKGQASRAAQLLVDKQLVTKHNDPTDKRGAGRRFRVNCRRIHLLARHPTTDYRTQQRDFLLFIP